MKIDIITERRVKHVKFKSFDSSGSHHKSLQYLCSVRRQILCRDQLQDSLLDNFGSIASSNFSAVISPDLQAEFLFRRADSLASIRFRLTNGLAPSQRKVFKINEHKCCT